MIDIPKAIDDFAGLIITWPEWTILGMSVFILTFFLGFILLKLR